VRNGPGGELCAVAQVPQVVDVAEQLRLQAGLAIKNPPKKNRKNHLKNPLKMFFFWVFWVIFQKDIKSTLNQELMQILGERG
jgi:hypothetical protein